VIVPALPASLAPPQPFPLVVAQSHETEFVAPGVRRGIYRLQTSDGPMVVTVVAIDTHEPTIRFGSVIANDRLISAGETVSSMAHRTGAIAGVNADYFDIGQTNQPLNVVVRGGDLVRTPSKRIVLDVRTDGRIAFENFSFAGSVAYGATSLPLTSVNEWPPQGGVAFLTPAFGALRAMPGVDVAQLASAGPLGSASDIAGAYRVASVGASDAFVAMHPTVTGALLGFGPAARALGGLPRIGDLVSVVAATVPPLDEVATAVGGGPLLVRNDAPIDDPNSPAPEERDRRFPVSGAATMGDGELLLVAVDGRRPALSIGVTRPQFAALMLGFGASNAMAFDSGGSATLVARVLGDAGASVLNAPSDGEERPIGDGLFVYSDAPNGPPAMLIARPSHAVALPDVPVRVALALVDASGHAVSRDREPPPAVIAGAPSSRVAIVRSGALATSVSVDVVARLARLDIEPDRRDPDPRDAVVFVANGIDARGRIVELGDRVAWSTDRGRFARPGVLIAPDRDAHVVATVAGSRADWVLRVGRHREALALFDATRAPAWHFDAAPPGAKGGIAFAQDRSEMSLRYDFTSGERAAYANTGVALPGEPQTFAVEILGNDGGVGVRAAFVNTFGERRALTLVRTVDWTGWREIAIPLPVDLSPPVRLVSLYAVDSLANAPSRAAGTLAFRNAAVVVAGRP
jgi:hypothetical protein